MKTRLLAVALSTVLAFGAVGCYESLTSIATPDKLVADDDLPGDYQAVDPGTGRLTIAKGEGKTYTFRQFDEKGEPTSKGTLQIVKLGGAQFYQITVDGYATLDGKPVYAIGRIVIEGKAGAKTMTGFAFKSKEQFFDAIGVVTSEYAYKENGEEKRSRALAMSAESLQAYLAGRAGEMTEPTLKFQQTAAAR
jgi:hypothetical protein